MSEVLDNMNAIVADRESATSDVVVNLRTGESFKAEIEAVQDIVLNTELGRDPRENTIFHVNDKVAASKINSNDRLSALGSTFLVLPGMRKDNPASAQVDFGCMKIVTGKDA